MIPAMAMKIVAITPPGAILDNTSPTTAVVDTLGFNWADIYMQLGAMDIAMTALKLQESDASGSGFADISGATFNGGTQTDGTTAALPSATADNGFYVFRVPLQGRKRYLDLVATVGDGAAGTYLNAFAILSLASESPSSMTQRGVAGEILV